MSALFSKPRKLLRLLSLRLLPAFLLVVLGGALASQFTELGKTGEILSLSSFVVLLSSSGLAFNWSRVPNSFLPEQELRSVYRVGVDLFIASLTALVSSFFGWLQISPLSLPKIAQPILFGLHWFFLLLALGLAVPALIDLVGISRKNDGEKKEV